MFSMLFIGFSTIALGLNIFLHYTDNPWFNLTFLLINIVFCIIGAVSFIKRQNIQQKQMFVIKEVLHSIGETEDSNMQDVRLKIDTLKQTNTKYKNEKDSLYSQIKLFSMNFQTILKLLNYLKLQDDEIVKDLVKALKDGINQDYETTKHILNEVGSYKTNYDNIDEKKVFYEGCNAAIIIKSPLRAFLLKLYLLEYGVSSNIFENNSIYHDCFDIVFIDEELVTTDKPNMVFFGVNRQQNRFYMQDIFSKVELQNILKKYLSHKPLIKTEKSAFNVLIFRKNEFNNKIMLKMSDSCVSGNAYVESISALLKEMKNKYKIIVLEYEAIMFDFENIKNEIYTLKSEAPYTKIILLPGQNYKSLDFDFADIIIKEDMNQSDFIKMIKDNL